MHISNVKDVPKEKVEMNGVEKVWIQWLVASKEGAENYAMRLFTVEPGGVIGKHEHPWEHEIFFLEGRGIVGAGDEEREVDAGSFAYIEPDVPHWYRNTGDTDWKFLCIIPMKGAGGR